MPAALAAGPEAALSAAVADLLRAVRGEVRAGDGGDAIAGMLARHALVEPVSGCAVCVLQADGMVRVAGVAGTTGEVIPGSRWDLDGSPVSDVLKDPSRRPDSSPSASPLGQAMVPDVERTLTGVPLRLGDHGAGEPTSLGALLLVLEPGAPLAATESDFIERFASLVSLAVLKAAPAQDWTLRARRLRGTAAAAVDVAGSLDARRVIPRVLEQVCDTVEAQRALLLRVDGADVVAEGIHDLDRAPPAGGLRWAVESQPTLLAAIRSGDTVISGGGEARFHDGLAADPACRHALVLPLLTGGAATGALVVFRRASRPFIRDDADALRQLGEVALLALRNARLYAEAVTASEAMSTFLNLVVHDLRAPLAVLAGYVDLLRDGNFGPAPPEWTHPMDLIAAKLQETHRLVDDLLLAARLESDAVPTTLSELDLNDVIDRAAKRLEPRAALVGASVVTAPSPAPVRAWADAFHVDRIIDNLVNNAIDYGGETPWIRISTDGAERPTIRVEDRGVGISTEMHERIFDRFVRVESAVPGTGFGLHVGRVLAEACGGSLDLEASSPGEGSVFRLRLQTPSAADRRAVAS